MRRIVSLSASIACLLLAGCGGAPSTVTTTQNSNSATSAPEANSGGQGGAGASNVGVVAAHGGAGNTSAGGAAFSDKAPLATPELDAKIEKVAAKAKTSGATDADKKAAAKAYFDRADYYREQGSPVLYKFALADYRRGLRLDPADQDARSKMDEIVSIYQSMGRPVPELGKEQ